MSGIIKYEEEILKTALESMQTEGYTLLNPPSKASFNVSALGWLYDYNAGNIMDAEQGNTWTVQNGYTLPVSPGEHSIHLSFDSFNSNLDKLSAIPGCQVYYTMENVKRP